MEISQQINSVIDNIASKLQVPASKLCEVLATQTYVRSCTNIIIGMIMIFIAITLVFFSIKKTLKYFEVKEKEDARSKESQGKIDELKDKLKKTTRLWNDDFFQVHQTPEYLELEYKIRIKEEEHKALQKELHDNQQGNIGALAMLLLVTAFSLLFLFSFISQNLEQTLTGFVNPGYGVFQELFRR